MVACENTASCSTFYLASLLVDACEGAAADNGTAAADSRSHCLSHVVGVGMYHGTLASGSSVPALQPRAVIPTPHPETGQAMEQPALAVATQAAGVPSRVYMAVVVWATLAPACGHAAAGEQLVGSSIRLLWSADGGSSFKSQLVSWERLQRGRLPHVPGQEPADVRWWVLYRLIRRLC